MGNKKKQIVKEEDVEEDVLGREIDLYFNCLDLHGALVETQPCYQVKIQFLEWEDWLDIGETEWIENDRNPRFTVPVRVVFKFEVEQYIKVQLFEKSSKQEIAHFETNLATIMAQSKNL